MLALTLVCAMILDGRRLALFVLLLLRPSPAAADGNYSGNKTFVVQDPADGCVARDPRLVLLDFENANLTINDMGGSGMRFANVGTTPNGRLIDLAVSNLTTYEAWRPQQNGKKGGFGAINSKAPRPRRPSAPQRGPPARRSSLLA